jgi:hypothetical protein
MICLDNVETFIITNKCNCKLFLHEKCFITWSNLYDTCIICKSKLNIKNNNLTLKINYFNKEFENSHLISFFDYVMLYILVLSDKIKNEFLEFFIINFIIAPIASFVFIVFLIIIGINSQIKYYYDYFTNSNNNKLYSIFFIK